MRSLQGNLSPRPVQGLGLSFPCNDQTDEVNKLFIVWPFSARVLPPVDNETRSSWALFVIHTKAVSVF